MTQTKEMHADKMRRRPQLAREPKIPPRWLAVITQVLGRHGLTMTHLFSGSREAPIVDARHQCCRVLRNYGLSYPLIGRYVGVHHTSALYACKQTGAVTFTESAIPVPDYSGEWAI